jgi:hypothetical protein
MQVVPGRWEITIPRRCDVNLRERMCLTIKAHLHVKRWVTGEGRDSQEHLAVEGVDQAVEAVLDLLSHTRLSEFRGALDDKEPPPPDDTRGTSVHGGLGS